MAGSHYLNRSGYAYYPQRTVMDRTVFEAFAYNNSKLFVQWLRTHDSTAPVADSYVEPIANSGLPFPPDAPSYRYLYNSLIVAYTGDDSHSGYHNGREYQACSLALGEPYHTAYLAGRAAYRCKAIDEHWSYFRGFYNAIREDSSIH